MLRFDSGVDSVRWSFEKHRSSRPTEQRLVPRPVRIPENASCGSSGHASDWPTNVKPSARRCSQVTLLTPPLLLLFSALVPVNCCAADDEETDQSAYSVRQITFGRQHHLFGYIGHVGNIPWNGDGRYVLALRSSFQDHMPQPTEPAEILLLDTMDEYRARKVDETRGWNLQQGTISIGTRKPRTRNSSSTTAILPTGRSSPSCSTSREVSVYVNSVSRTHRLLTAESRKRAVRSWRSTMVVWLD
jgi:hypothetical protein